MSTIGRMFWYFALAFYAGVIALAVYLHESEIAAMAGFFLGTTLEQFRRSKPTATAVME